MTDRIRDYLRDNPSDGPRLVVDLDVVERNYERFAHALPDTRVFYAVKANPAPEILDLLARLGSSFDCASVVEIEQVLATGAGAERISFGNTIKKERDIARAHALGVAPLRRRLRGRGREDRPRRPRRARCSAASCATAPAPNGRCRRSSAARPRWRSACSSTPMRSASRPMACRSMSARSRAMSRPGTRRSSTAAGIFRELAGARHRALDGQYGRRLPGPLPQGRARRAGLWRGDLPVAVAPFRQPHARRRSSSRAAAWSATPA